MGLQEIVKHNKQILMEGGIIERLRRSGQVQLDPHTLHAGFIYEEYNKGVLEGLYRQYISIGEQYDLPMLNLTATWRATKERINQAGLGHRDVNGDCVRHLISIRNTYGSYSQKMLIGGLVGCQGDTYKAEEALDEKEAAQFHSFQLRRLTEAGVDFLFASAMPALSESLGMAKVMAEMKIPYIISFIVRPQGTLLDGTWLHEAIEKIDNQTTVPPDYYMVNCVHPSNFKKCIESNQINRATILSRLIGLQANTSLKSPEELDNLCELDSQEPEPFADLMVALYRDYGTKILGGCCGSDNSHIEQIASRLSKLKTVSK